MSHRRPIAKTTDRLFTRTELRRLTGLQSSGEFTKYQLMGLVKPQRLANGTWIYSRDDVAAIRAYRTAHGLRCPAASDFD